MTSDQLTRPAGSAASPAGPGAGGGAPTPRPARLPFVVYVLAVGMFLMLTTEFVVAGLWAQSGADLKDTKQGRFWFREDFEKHLSTVQAFYPVARVETTPERLVLLLSRPHVSRRRRPNP